jgi:uncharacterized membrane protein YuzA (DUF378 family)
MNTCVKVEGEVMKSLNLTTLVLVIVGGLNWGLVGLFRWDLVAALFGPGTLVSRVIYVLVGLSALWQMVPWTTALSRDEPGALRGGALK